MSLPKHRFPASVALLALGLAATWWGRAQEPEPATGRSVTVLRIQGAIGPATSDYVVKGLAHASEQAAELAVIEMDTPGGLDTSMREIIQAILASDVPVATFVYPEGARAASAGTYILYASHVAAMAPATNLGAATPVAIGGSSPVPMPGGEPDAGSPPSADGDADSGGAGSDAPGSGDADDSDDRGDRRTDDGDGEASDAPGVTPGSASELKAVNDAVAYIRSLAERRGRNADWAERAVRSAASLSASAALDNDVIDLVAGDLSALLSALDGETVSIGGEDVELELSGAVVDRFEPDWRTRFLAVISNPTIAYMLMLIGIYGLIFEGYNPGAIVPGVVGALSLLLALFAFQILPVNYAGLALIALGIILMIAEFMVPSFGALGMGGVIAFVLGSLILVDTDVPGFQVALPLIGAIAGTAGLAMLGVIWFAMKARERPIVSGAEQIEHSTVSAIDDFDGYGSVWLYGERWRAHAAQPVRKGQPLRVTKVDGLLLHVEPLNP